jgi:hypothetical protein
MACFGRHPEGTNCFNAPDPGQRLESMHAAI